MYRRLAYLLGSEDEAREWVRQALDHTWHVLDPADLRRAQRGLALQKVSGVVLALEDVPYDLTFAVDVRQTVAAAFAKYFHGAVLDGPEWAISPAEVDRLSFAAWNAETDFGGTPPGDALSVPQTPGDPETTGKPSHPGRSGRTAPVAS